MLTNAYVTAQYATSRHNDLIAEATRSRMVREARTARRAERSTTPSWFGKARTRLVTLNTRAVSALSMSVTPTVKPAA